MPDESTPLGACVVRIAGQGLETWALPLGVPQVVSFRASFRTGIDLAGPQGIHQRVAVRMLDRGSAHRDRFEIAAWLEGRGADLSFFADGPRVGCSGRALRQDVGDVLALAAELLGSPRFDLEELEKVKREMEAGFRRAATDTAYLSGAALRQALYAPDHPGYTAPLGEQRARVRALDRGDLIGFHERHLARSPGYLAMAGDLGGLDIEKLVAPLMGRGGAAAMHEVTPARQPEKGRAAVPVPDKTNVDVSIGHGVRLRRTDPAYQPLRVGIYALGGNFSARLMQEVRDRQGLTYGIRAALQEVTVEHDGHFEISATFSPADLDRGLEATANVLALWRAQGTTGEEVERVKETLLGVYDVGLSTTRGLASTMLHRAESGFPPAYLDTYRDDLAAVGAEDVNAAIGNYTDAEAVFTALSGPLA